MYCDLRIKTPVREGDIFGRLTPPPEDVMETDQGFFSLRADLFGEQSCCDKSFLEEENFLLNLEFETLCSREFDGFQCGPTLAELNDTRSRSPLINPEMKRLHQVAILTGVDTDEEPMCDGTASGAKTQSCSVLEQQLRTQHSASVYREQCLPNYSSCSTAVSSTVTKSEAIPIPIKGSQLSQSVCMSPPSPQDKKPLAESLYHEKKPFEQFYQTQSIQQPFSAPAFGTSYLADRGDTASSSYTAAPSSRSNLIQQAFKPSASHEQVSDRAATNAYQSETYEESEEDEDEIDGEDSDDAEDAEEYCPFQKGEKTPTRRKGRKSESEDMVPNPTKLLNIGRELDRLNKIISSLKPINEVPQQSRGRSRREKNKLASRACRLKKKQQHEANKVKLHGLESEQESLMFAIKDMKNEIMNRALCPRKSGSPLNEKFKNMAKKAFAQQIAGHTTEFVRGVLQEVARGNKTGGLTLPPVTDEK